MSTPVGSGALASEHTIPAAHRTMVIFLAALVAIVRASGSDARGQADLDRRFAAWVQHRAGPDVAGRVAWLGVTVWTRLHGVLTPELTGHFAPVGFDPALLYDAEVEALLDEAG